MSGVSSETALVAESTEVLAQHGRSFSLASVFLPTESRGEAAVLYAFCRLADDEVDEAEDPETARANVARLRSELEGKNPRPVVAKTREILEPIGLTAAFDLLDGVESDLDFSAPETDDDLLLYCYQVAGTVGLMMCAVLGVNDPVAWRHAVDLGIGMQLTNISRDVLEDAAMGRVYLPRTRLENAGMSADDLLAGRADPEKTAEVVHSLLEMADRYYASGRAGMPEIPLRSRIGIAIAARLYQGIGHRLRRAGCNVLDGRTVVPIYEKAWLLLRGSVDWIAPDEEDPLYPGYTGR